MADTIPDDAVCCFCEQSGLLVACDGCNKTMHWWCNDEDHQPTADGYYCKDCSAEKGITNKPHAFLHHTCLICFEAKPADQFVKTVPECPCHVGDNRSCALCVYKMVHTAEGDASKCRCPTCRATFTKFVLPPTANSAPQEVLINPTSAVNDDGFGSMPVLSDDEYVDDDEDDDDDDDDYDADSVVGAVAPSRLHRTRGSSSRGSAASSDDSSGSDCEPDVKRRKGPTKSRVMVVPKEQCPSAGIRPSKNPKKDSGYRLVGTLPNLITDADHKLSKYDKSDERARIFKAATENFSGDDLTDPNEMDPDTVAAHCFVLMFRAGYQVGATGSSSLTKYHKRIRTLMKAERGLTTKAQFKKSFEPVVRELAERVAAEEVKRESLKTPVHIVVKNYISVFNCYCKMLEKEQKGEINAVLE